MKTKKGLQTNFGLQAFCVFPEIIFGNDKILFLYIGEKMYLCIFIT